MISDKMILPKIVLPAGLCIKKTVWSRLRLVLECFETCDAKTLKRRILHS